MNPSDPKRPKEENLAPPGIVPHPPKPDDGKELHLVSDGDTLEDDDLEVDPADLPVFGTHADRSTG
jgi:hypothetical protein